LTQETENRTLFALSFFVWSIVEREMKMQLAYRRGTLQVQQTHVCVVCWTVLLHA